MQKWGGARKPEKKKSSGGGGSSGQVNMLAVMTGAMVLGMGLIGVILIVEVFGDLLTNSNLEAYIGLSIVLSIIPTVSCLSVAASGMMTSYIGAKGGSMSLRDALDAPMVLVIAGVMVPFLVAINDDLLNSTYISNFTALDVVASIVLTFYALGLMGIAAKMMYQQKKSRIG